jgi:hypothetical protein
MKRKPNLHFFCVLLLLVAETVQGVTPDLGSVTSTKLAQMVGHLTEPGRFRRISFPGVKDSSLPSNTSTLPAGSIPIPDDEPDEVCLAGFKTASQIARDAVGKTKSAMRCPADLLSLTDLARCHNSRLSARFVVGRNQPLFHSICCLTC